jgi:hypothetical protein
MTRLHRMVLAASLLAAPILLAAGEAARKYVEQGRSETGDPVARAGEKISFIAGDMAMWQLHGYLTLAGALAWLGAVVAVTRLVSERRPVLGLVGGALGFCAGLGWALHLGFYTVPLSLSAAMADTDLTAAATVWAAGDSDAFGTAMVLFFILSNLLAHLALGWGLWRARVVPWWAAACLAVVPVLALEPGPSPVWAATLLIPVIPFTMVAVRLLASARVAVIPTPAPSHG